VVADVPASTDGVLAIGRCDGLWNYAPTFDRSACARRNGANRDDIADHVANRDNVGDADTPALTVAYSFAFSHNLVVTSRL